MYQPNKELSQKNASSVLLAGRAEITSGETEFDLSSLEVVDSTAVAAMLDWQRTAAGLGKMVRFHNIQTNLKNLIALYGVAELLSPADDQRH